MSDVQAASSHDIKADHGPQSHHHPELRHHFNDMAQQFESSHMGMWLFLITEIMFFGAMFAAYTVYRSIYPEAFADTSRHMDLYLGTFNTAVLIGSSLTMALAVRASQTNANKALGNYLLATMALGFVFLGVKAYEYSHKWHEHLVPGPHFQYEGPYAQQAALLFAFYFAMTGMHAIHMIIGEAVLFYLYLSARANKYSEQYYTPVELTGLYWHFVDIVWIFLFPLLYLIGPHALQSGGGH